MFWTPSNTPSPTLPAVHDEARGRGGLVLPARLRDALGAHAEGHAPGAGHGPHGVERERVRAAARKPPGLQLRRDRSVRTRFVLKRRHNAGTTIIIWRRFRRTIKFHDRNYLINYIR